MVYTLSYSNIHESDKDLVGARALCLSFARNNNINTGLFFVLTSSAFKFFFEHNNIQEQLIKLKDVKEEDFWVELKKVVSQGEFPDDVLRDIRESYNALSVSDNAANNILRSFDARVNMFISSEKDFSLEGVFLNFKGFDNILRGIKSCWFSFLKRQSKSSLLNNNFNFCGVVIEKFISSEFSVEVELARSNLNLFVYKGLPDISFDICKDSYNLSLNHLEFLGYELVNQNFSIIHQEDSGVLLKKRLGRAGSDNKASKQVISECARFAKKFFLNFDESVRLVFLVKRDVPFLSIVDFLNKPPEEFDSLKRSLESLNSSLSAESEFKNEDFSETVDLPPVVDSDLLFNKPDNISSNINLVEETRVGEIEDKANNEFDDSDEFIIQGESQIKTDSPDYLSSFFKLIELLEEDITKAYVESFGFSPSSFEDAVFELDSKHSFSFRDEVLEILKVKSSIMQGEEISEVRIGALCKTVEEFLRRDG
ncbi:MAG: PEP/pyruvate-binding domain-containing protein [Candidatus Woesearchaeota archaeon]